MGGVGPSVARHTHQREPGGLKEDDGLTADEVASHPIVEVRLRGHAWYLESFGAMKELGADAGRGCAGSSSFELGCTRLRSEGSREARDKDRRRTGSLWRGLFRRVGIVAARFRHPMARACIDQLHGFPSFSFLPSKHPQPVHDAGPHLYAVVPARPWRDRAQVSAARPSCEARAR